VTFLIVINITYVLLFN